MNIINSQTTENIQASILERGFDLNLLPHNYTTLLRFQSPSYRNRLVNELILLLFEIRVQFKQRGYDWNQLEFSCQQHLFQHRWEMKKKSLPADFGDTRKRMEAVQLHSDRLDKDIAEGRIIMKKFSTINTEEIAEQNAGNRTETGQIPTIAPEVIHAGTSQMSDGLTPGSQHESVLLNQSQNGSQWSTESQMPKGVRLSNGFAPGSQGQPVLKRVHAHTPEKPSPLIQSISAEEI